MGTIELHLSAADRGSAEVGYWLRPQARGHGAATIALRLVSRWACEKLGIERLNLTTAPQNTASQRVADRAGFTKGRRLLAGSLLDVVRRRWHSRRAAPGRGHKEVQHEKRGSDGQRGSGPCRPGAPRQARDEESRGSDEWDDEEARDACDDHQGGGHWPGRAATARHLHPMMVSVRQLPGPCAG